MKKDTQLENSNFEKATAECFKKVIMIWMEVEEKEMKSITKSNTITFSNSKVSKSITKSITKDNFTAFISSALFVITWKMWL